MMGAERQNVNHRRALNRLVEQGLLRRVDVNEKQRGGRRGTTEYLYFLSDVRGGEAVATAARRYGLKNARQAKDRYMRGGLKGRHTRIKNDFAIRAVLDSERRDDVSLDREEVWGSAYRGFPLRGAKIETDAAGRKLSGLDLQRAGYEEVLPDAYLPFEWPGVGLRCPIYLELELWIRTETVADKIDAYAAAYARMYDDREKRFAKEHTANIVLKDQFAGLPPEVAPVIFLYEQGATARRMRTRLFESGLMDRFDAFDDNVGRFGLEVGRLFLFCGLDEIVPRVRYSDPVLGELRENDGHVFDAVYAAFNRHENGSYMDTTTLLDAAEFQRKWSIPRKIGG